MCAIAGIISKSGVPCQQVMQEMCMRMTLRGPDAEGYYFNQNIALGHRRLSIIDLQTGNQPMSSYDGSVVAVFNGEIYNFKQLRQELVEKGIQFHTTSDTEVLINGYLVYGIDDTLNRLEGMFAFALHDKKNDKLFIARDKFGEKPLYYSMDEKTFWFASELKAFPSEILGSCIDPQGLNYFLTLSYIPAPYTIYQNIRKLLPGHYLVFDKKHFGEMVTYFDLAAFVKNLTPLTDFEESVIQLRELVCKSVQNRMISDVPVGVFLSGGIDSSIVTALMAGISKEPINTFTIGFKERSYDESKRANLVAKSLGSNHTVHYLDFNDVVKIVDEIILHYDEPFGDSSAIPFFFVAKLASEKVKVVLTGDCADELFGGYEKYLGGYYSNKLNRLPKLVRSLFKGILLKIPHNSITNVFLRKAKKVINILGLTDFDLYYNLTSLGFKDKERAELLKPEWYYEIKAEIERIYNAAPGRHPLEKSQFTDIKLVLEGDMFVKSDRVCMKNSIESRAPFIDTKIVEIAFRIPPQFKINGRKKKLILKKAFKNVLPGRTIRFRKKGFGVPVDLWFRSELRQELESLLSKTLIDNQGIFNYEVIQRLFEEHQSGTENHKIKLWNLFVFQKWYQKNILNEAKTC